MIVQWNMGQVNKTSSAQLPCISGCKLEINSISYSAVDPDGTLMVSSEGCSTPDIEILGATRFNELSASVLTIL